MQVQLVIVLSIPPLASLEDFRRHLAAVPLLIDLGGNFLCDLLLLGIVIENGTAVLGARVVTLSVAGGRVVRAVKELNELLVGDFCWVVDDLGSFGICPWKLRLVFRQSRALTS